MWRLSRFLWIAVVAAMILMFGNLPSVGEPHRPSKVSESEAQDAANRWASLVGGADIAGLEQFLNDNYMHIHATALVESKSQFIEALKTGTRKYDPIKIEEAKARLFGDCAIITGKFNLKAFSRGRTIEGVNRFGLVITKTPSGLQAVSFQATPIPQQK